MGEFLLIGEVSRLLGVRPHQVAYAVSSGLVAEPALRIGNKRVFRPEDMERLRAFFRSRKENRHAKA